MSRLGVVWTKVVAPSGRGRSGLPARARISIAVMCMAMAALLLPTTAALSAASGDDPLHVWIVTGSGISSRWLEEHSAFYNEHDAPDGDPTWGGGSDEDLDVNFSPTPERPFEHVVEPDLRLPDGGYPVTVFVENTSESVIEDVSVRLGELVECTQSVGQMVPGAEARRSFRCVIPASAFSEFESDLGPDVLGDSEFLDGVVQARYTAFKASLSADGVLAGDAVATQVDIDLFESREPGGGLDVELVSLGTSADRRTALVRVTNSTSLDSLFGGLTGFVQSDLPQPWSFDRHVECEQLPGRLSPGGVAEADCSWPLIAASTDRLLVRVDPPGPIESGFQFRTAELVVPPDPTLLTVEVAPRQLAPAADPDPSVDITVVNVSPGVLTDVQVDEPVLQPLYSGSVEPAFASCASTIGFLAPGERRSWTCSGSDWTPGRLFVRATGFSGDDAEPTGASATALIHGRAQAEVDVKVVPPFQVAPPGSTAEFSVRVGVPEVERLVVDLYAFDPLHPQCDLTRSAFDPWYWSQPHVEFHEFRCEVTVPSDGVAEYEPHVVAHYWDPRPGFFDPTAETPQQWAGGAARGVARAGAPQDLSIAVVPGVETVRHGGGTTLDVSVTNTSSRSLSEVETALLAEQLVDGRNPFNANQVELSPDCGRTLGVLAAGETRQYRCELNAPRPSAVGTGSIEGRELRLVEIRGHAFVQPSESGPSTVGASDRVLLQIDGTDRLEVEVLEPTQPVRAGEPADFTVRVTNRGGTEYGQVTVWSADLPGCYRTIYGGELPPGNTEPVAEYQCRSLLGMDADPSAIRVNVAGGFVDEGGITVGDVASSTFAIPVQQVPVPDPTTTIPVLGPTWQDLCRSWDYTPENCPWSPAALCDPFAPEPYSVFVPLLEGVVPCPAGLERESPSSPTVPTTTAAPASPPAAGPAPGGLAVGGPAGRCGAVSGNSAGFALGCLAVGTVWIRRGRSVDRVVHSVCGRSARLGSRCRRRGVGLLGASGGDRRAGPGPGR